MSCKPTIVVDGMLGKLSRWLRMLGVKTIFVGDLADWEIEEVLEKCQGPVLLTRDRDLCRRASLRGFNALYVPEAPIEDQLSFVLSRLGIEPVLDMSSALCPLCGSELVRVSREEVSRDLPRGVVERYQEFYRCTNCGQVYWCGTHFYEIEKTIEKVRWIMHGKVVC